MSKIEFEEEKGDTSSEIKFGSRRILGAPEIPSTSRFFMRSGIVKTEQHAYYLLLAIMIIFFSLSIFILLFFYFGSNKAPLYHSLNEMPPSERAKIPPQLLELLQRK